MNAFLSPLFGAFVAFMFGSPGHFSLPDPGAEPWTCDQPAWVGTPGLKNNMFYGTLATHCRVEGQSGKGMSELQQHLVSYVKGSAETVHAGPTPETYENMPSYYTDVTIQMGNDQESVLVRADTHSATDGITRLVYAVLSKQVNGSGNAKALKKIDATSEVVPTAEKNIYEVTLNTSTQVQKPSLVPSGLFVSQVKSEMMKQAQEAIPEVMTEFSGNL